MEEHKPKSANEESKPKPTIEDVAKHCGVSVSTVSRVINKSTPVSRELNLKVKHAIEELGFIPRQRAARAGIDMIVLVIPNVSNPYYGEILTGAQEEADRLGVKLLMLNVTENPKFQKKYLVALKNVSFDGLVVMGTKFSSDYLLDLYNQYNVPVVLAARQVDVSQIPCIIANTESATSQLVQYLLNLNHKRIAYISGPRYWDSVKRRSQTIQRALSESGLTLPSSLYRWCFPNIEEGAQTTNSLLALPEEERPTAIIAFNDLIAIGALHAIRTAGLSVPQDISVIGFDDIAMAAYTNPALTTVSQPKYRIGQLSVKKVYDLIHGHVETEGSSISLECPFILRESTAPCLK